MQEEVIVWQNRWLATLYPIVVFDALQVKIRDGGSVQDEAVHLALGICPDGLKQVPGLWIESNEGAKFWLPVMTEWVPLRDSFVRPTSRRNKDWAFTHHSKPLD